MFFYILLYDLNFITIDLIINIVLDSHRQTSNRKSVNSMQGIKISYGSFSVSMKQSSHVIIKRVFFHTSIHSFIQTSNTLGLVVILFLRQTLPDRDIKVNADQADLVCV